MLIHLPIKKKQHVFSGFCGKPTTVVQRKERIISGLSGILRGLPASGPLRGTAGQITVPEMSSGNKKNSTENLQPGD